MLTRQEGGKGLVGKHKSDMEESEEQEDLGDDFAKNDKEDGHRRCRRNLGGGFP